MKQNWNFILVAVFSLIVAACSSESDKTAGQKLEKKAEEMGSTLASAADATSATVKETVMPVVESATNKVEELAESTKSAVTESVAQATDTVKAAATQANEMEGTATAAEPTEHIIKGVITQWQPLVTFAQPGDTIRFTGMTGHDTASMEGMIPEGATPWHSKLGQEGFTVTVDKIGGYVYKCTPHITTGMVGIIVVGDRNPANLAQLEENASNVKVGGNMVKRAIRKLKKQLTP